MGIIIILIVLAMLAGHKHIDVFRLIYVITVFMVMLFPITLPPTWANQDTVIYYLITLFLLWLLSFKL